MADTAERDKTLDFSWSKMVHYFLDVMFYLLGMWFANPFCTESPHFFMEEIVPGYPVINSDVKIMMLGDMLLSGSQAGYIEEYLFQKYFVQALRNKKPDAVIVVGDLSAKGADSSVLKQFKRYLASSSVQAYHVVMGDKDIGGCSKLNKAFFESLSTDLPVFRSSGSGSASILINGVYFYSLNSMALVCENNDLRSTVERELREELQTRKKVDVSWMRGNTTSYRYGPFLILHFPLYPKLGNRCKEHIFLDRRRLYKTVPEISEFGTGPVELTKTLAENDTRYILEKFRPRMVFSGHAQRYCNLINPNGMPKIFVSPMTWNDHNVPAFVFVTFKTDGTVTTELCRLIARSDVWILCLYLALTVIVVVLRLR